MKFILLACAVSLQVLWCSGLPSSKGVGAFAYQDSEGNRYGGTYGLKDGVLVNTQGNFPENFQPERAFHQLDEFFPVYFNNLQNLLQEVFRSNIEHQMHAYNAATKAYDLTLNQAGYNPNFAFRFPAYNNFGGGGFGAFPDFSDGFMSNIQNAAFAGAMASPGFSHQIAAINPGNPSVPNVNKVNQYSDSGTNRNSNFVSVSSSSYSSSVNSNGEVLHERGAETIVNDNGRVTRYKVQS